MSVLTTGSRGASAGTSQATAAITPPSGGLVLAVIGTVDATFPATIPTSAVHTNNAGLTYTKLISQGANDGGFGDTASIWYAWNPGVGASGALTWSGWGASGADTMAWWAVYGLTGVRADNGGIGSSLGKTAQGTSAGTAVSADMTPIDARGDSQVFMFAYHASEEGTTPPTGFTEDLDSTVVGGGTGSAYHSLNDPTIDGPTWATSSTFVALAVEVLAARSLVPNPSRPRRQTCRRRSGLVLARP